MNVSLVLEQHFVLSQPKETELTLLQAARSMDRGALMEIFDRYSPALYNYVFRLSHDPLITDYIVGDVFAKLLDQFSAGKGPSTNLRSYLYETAYHLVVDEARYSNRGAPLEAVDIQHKQDDGYNAYVTLENQILFENVMHIVRNNLTNDQRHVIILRFLEGFSLQETAAIIGKEVNHVKVIQNRAISTLRRFLDHHAFR